MAGANSRATPSGVMMKGITPSSGAASGRMSGMSLPPQAVPVHLITVRFGSQGLPATSQLARL
jgi:hypothetical protein